MATWLTSPLESNESGNLVMATLRKDVDKFRTNPRFKYRVEVTWKYDPDVKAMPSEETAKLMEQVIDRLTSILDKDPIAVMTEVYTGEGARDMVFYTLSLHIFQRKFNEAMEGFPILPLTFSAEEDPQWEEYTQMLSVVETSDGSSDETIDEEYLS